MAVEAQTSPSPPLSTDHAMDFWYAMFTKSPPGFLEHMRNDEVHCVGSRLAAAVDGDGDRDVIKDRIKRFLQLRTPIWWPYLVQFWGLVKIGGTMYLTTRHQPSALSHSYLDCYGLALVNKLCEYRKHCLKYLIRTVDDDDAISVDGVGQLIGGPLSRVFCGGFPEYAHDVRDYTSREYPLRDYAVGRVREYLALPVYHHHTPSGVLEFASLRPSFFSTYQHFACPRELFVAKLQEVNLTIPCLSLAEIHSCQDGEIAKIDEALSKVDEILEMDGTQIWTAFGEILSSQNGKAFIRKGQGVVGKAFSSKSVCFCRDIRQLSIAEYPTVPIARHYAYSASFAVCLQSSCSNSCIYVLEFFLPTNEKYFGDSRKLLHILMETLKEHLQSSFKIASGQELWQKLSVEVLKASPEDEFDSFEICNTTGVESTPRLGEVQGGEGMMQLDFSSQQVDAANGSMNGIHEQQNGSVGSTPRLATAQGGEGMMQVDFSSQQVDTANAYTSGVHGQQSGIVGSPARGEHVQGFVNISYQESMAVQCNASNLARVDAANNSINGIYEQESGIIESSPRQELVQNIENIAHDEPSMEIDVASPERDDVSIEQSANEVINIKKPKSSYTLKSDLGITREVLEQNSSRNLEDAAKVLGVSRSTLKRICREYGIHRWPPRKIRKINQAFVERRVVQPSIENIEEHHQPDATRLEDDSCIWVKAEYQGYTMKLRLPLSAHKSNLEEEVAQRLDSSIGSFKIEYQDEENDWIWIACDKDLSIYVNTLNSLGRKTIKMKVKGSHIHEPL